MVISNLKSFFLGGGYSGVNFGHLKSEVFHLGGGGYYGVNFGHLKSEVFHWGGGASLVWNSRTGLSGEFGQKFTVWVKRTETCLCITDSLSHTTYVETNKLTVSFLHSIVCLIPKWFDLSNYKRIFVFFLSCIRLIYLVELGEYN